MPPTRVNLTLRVTLYKVSKGGMEQVSRRRRRVWNCDFYKCSDGSLPVKEFLKKQGAKVKDSVATQLDMLVMCDHRLGDLTHGRATKRIVGGGGLWELIACIEEEHQHEEIVCKRVCSVLYFPFRGKYVPVHALCREQTGDVPEDDLEKGRKRMDDYRSRYVDE